MILVLNATQTPRWRTLYTDINILFEWQRAIDTEDRAWEPPKEYFQIGSKFKIVNLVEEGYLEKGTIVYLAEDNHPQNIKQWTLFTTDLGKEAGNSDYLYWCEVKPL